MDARGWRLSYRLNTSHFWQVISVTHCQMFSFSQWIELMPCACVFDYIYFCECFYGQQWQTLGMNLRGNIVPILQCSFSCMLFKFLVFLGCVTVFFIDYVAAVAFFLVSLLRAKAAYSEIKRDHHKCSSRSIVYRAVMWLFLEVFWFCVLYLLCL